MAEPTRSDMPQIQFGAHKLSRLIVGSNPINGGSHLSRFVNMQMKRHFAPERVQEFLRRCEEGGSTRGSRAPATSTRTPNTIRAGANCSFSHWRMRTRTTLTCSSA